MLFFVCIDGGGTKTRIVIHGQRHFDDDSAVSAQGDAGPSNLTLGLDLCLQSTSTALEQAVAQLPPHLQHAISAPTTRLIVWAAYAGCARPADFALLRPPLQALFPNATLNLTSDGELLAAPMLKDGISHSVTLICGTGSLALAWRRAETGLERVRRSGGWGPVLGDEGSGWSLGRKGVKSVLTCAANGERLKAWHGHVLRHFDVDSADELLPAAIALDCSVSHFVAESRRKKRIAGAARIVVEAALDGDQVALQLVDEVAEEVVDTLRPLVLSADSCLSNNLLIVGGGLGQVDIFWNLVVARFAAEGWAWHNIVRIEDPAREGLEYMRRSYTPL